ncbi:MAG: putative O-glycosylation ligase, exosortase A system-associated [Magnetococcales bacterium]|nr:putative O-glycosylation ligase, exosortase A system-associated [Magnetococcales bacterium]
MRDLVLILFVFSILPIALFRPFIGLLLWAWIGYMNPHRLTWGFAYNFRFNLIIAAVTIIGILVTTRFRFRIPWKAPIVLTSIFLFWTVITTYYAFQYGSAVSELDRFIKIQLMVFATLIVVKNRKQIIALVTLIALSIGFYGVKGGFFTLTSGGNFRVMGPENSFFVDNNSFALAMLMTLPMIYFVQLQFKSLLPRLISIAAMLLCVLSILGSYSRGGFIGLSVLGITILIKSRHRFIIIALLFFVLPPVYQFMPEHWHNRMGVLIQSGLDSLNQKASSTISEVAMNQLNLPTTALPNKPVTKSHNIQSVGQGLVDFLLESDSEIVRDKSVAGRFDAWRFSIRVANANPILGGGFNTFDQSVYDRYTPGVQRRAPHSIFFEVLAEHGYVGFFIWLALHISGMLTASKVIRMTRRDPEVLWARDLAAMLQVSLISYYITGLFLGMAYFDLPYHIIAILVILRVHIENHYREQPAKAPSTEWIHPGLRQRRPNTTPTGRGDGKFPWQKGLTAR